MLGTGAHVLRPSVPCPVSEAGKDEVVAGAARDVIGSSEEFEGGGIYSVTVNTAMSGCPCETWVV
jgi:hypothetical protein